MLIQGRRDATEKAFYIPCSWRRADAPRSVEIREILTGPLCTLYPCVYDAVKDIGLSWISALVFL